MRSAASMFPSADEEQRLVSRIVEGRDAVGDTPVARAGQRALAELVDAHFGIVLGIARTLCAPPYPEDLLQEGNLGLVLAAHRFEPGRGCRFGTYASYWVRAYMLSSLIRDHGPVRIGKTRGERRIYFRIGRARRAIEARGEECDGETLAAELGVRVDELDAMLPRIMPGDVSLNATQRDDRVSVAESIADVAAPVEDLFADAEETLYRQKELWRRMGVLNERERRVIVGRYLLNRPLTLAAIGTTMAISRERVRQIESIALRKLGGRALSVRRTLEDAAMVRRRRRRARP